MGLFRFPDFLQNRIKFTDIAKIVEKAVVAHKPVSRPSLGEILAADAWAREQVGRAGRGDNK